MKKILFLFIFVSFLHKNFAQSVTISPTGTALIDAKSTTQGLLPPRVTMAQRTAISASAGLMVFCTDCTPAGPYSYDGSIWKPMFNTLTATGPSLLYTVGQQAQGGTVIFVDDSGQHGLVAAPIDVPIPSIPNAIGIYITPFELLGQSYFELAMGFGIYDGKKNTDAFVKNHGWNNYAAFLCRQMSFNNYGEWYLPSYVELALIAQNKNVLSGLTLTNGEYWSSTEASINQVFAIDMASGIAYPYYKQTERITVNNIDYPLRVRAVRRF